MKPFREEITGLRTGINKLSFLLVILFAVNAKCQIPINGFCKLSSFPIDSGYTGLLSLNYNNDFYTDLVIYSPLKNALLILEGNQTGSFLKFRGVNCNFKPSLIQNIYDLHKKVTGYAYVSRSSRKAGILNFTSEGIPKPEGEIKLDSYPDRLSSSDVDQDSVSELLLSGSAFDGLSLVSSVKGKLVEKKIAKGTIYSYSFFSDITDDGFIDIAAYNVLTRGIDLFYNNGAGHFTKERTLKVNGKIRSMKVFDLNLDSYQDIIFSYENMIDIYSGNFNASFTLSRSIKVKYSPDIFITSDFNKDGRIDIAYSDTSRGILSILFSGENSSFWEEVVYTKKENIRDIIPFYSKFINGLALLSSSGKVYTITNLVSLNEDTQIAPCITASSPQYCKANDDAVNDICFIDKFDSRIKIFINNSSGIPTGYYSFPLQQVEKKLLVSNKGLTFIAFSKGERFVEIIKPDLISGKKEQYGVYFKGNLTDVRAAGDSEDLKIYSAGYANNELLLASIDHYRKKEFYYKVKTTSPVIDAKILPGKLPSIYFWQNKGDSLTLYYSSFNGNNLDRPVEITTVKLKYFDNITTFVCGSSDYNSTVLSVINSGRHRHVIVKKNKYSFINSDNEITNKFDVTSEKQFYYGEAYFRGLNKLMFYSPSGRNIKWIEMVNRGSNIYFNKLLDGIDASEYFIKNLNLRNYNMVYVNKENCLSIRQIND